IAGVYATTGRRKIQVLRDETDKLLKNNNGDQKSAGPWVQVARQGNPLFNEGLVALADKDRYSRTSPESDPVLFRKYALSPELAKLINLLVLNNAPFKAPETNRTDIA